MQYKIFPYGILPDGTKVPLIKGWKDGAASNDPAQIKQWTEFYRDRIVGWGMPTGAQTGTYVLDIDVKDGRNGYEWLKSQGIVLPHTAHQYTPSGGLHLFFNYDPSIATKNSVNCDTGVDTRGDGGFVWLYSPDFSIPLCNVPPWIHQVLAKAVEKPLNTGAPVQLLPEKSMARFNDAIQSIRGAGVGERNNVLNIQSYIIGQLVSAGAVSEQYAQEQITLAAESIGLTSFEINATLKSGLKGGAANPLTHPFGDSPPVPALKIEAPLPDAPEIPTRWTPRYGTLTDLTNWQYLRKPQLFENWSSQDPILTSAIGGVGKTTLKLFEAVCLALGEPFLGFKCLKPGRTLFIIGEDSEQKLYAMLGRICKQMGLFEPGNEHKLDAVLSNVVIKLARDLCLVQFNKQTNTYVPNLLSLTKIREAVEDLRPIQIVFDPIAMFWGPESGGNDMAMALSKSILEIIEYSGASVDSIAHIGKDSATKKDVGQFSARGATALSNHSRIIRTIISLSDAEYHEETGEALTDGQSAIKCFVSKFSDGSPLLNKPFIILREGYLFSPKSIPESRQDGGSEVGNKTRIMDMIRAHSREDRPVTEKDCVDWAYTQQPKINKATTRSIIGNLKFEGVIEEIPHQDILVGNWLRIKGA